MKNDMMMCDEVKGEGMMRSEREVTPSSDTPSTLECGESQEEEIGRGCQDDKTLMVGMMKCDDSVKGEGERDDEKIGDEVIPRAWGDDEKLPGTPSSVSLLDEGERDLGTGQECNIVKGVCRNGCIVRTISYTVRRRVQNKKTLLWYDRSKKISKFVCVKKSSIRANLTNSNIPREVVKRI